MARRAKVIPFPHPPSESKGPSLRRTDEREFAEIRRCRDQFEALVIKGLFESEGIPCLLRSRLVHSVHPFSVGDQGEVIILVPEAEALRGRLLLARIAPDPSFP
jgi:hypothetical protein